MIESGENIQEAHEEALLSSFFRDCQLEIKCRDRISRTMPSSITVKLASGHQMPLVGFGLWKVPKESAAETVYNVSYIPPGKMIGNKVTECAT